VYGETRFAFVDVFAEHPLAGNPLAVVPDADHLDKPPAPAAVSRM
jgi:predicted PhzF superfamily epimerase YddE/YHI9